MKDLDNLREPSGSQGSGFNVGRVVALIILLFGLLSGAFLAWRVTTSPNKEEKKTNVQIPVTKKNPGQDFTFYNNLKGKNESVRKKENIVGLIPPSTAPSPSAHSLSPRFTLQAGSMKDYQKALHLSDKLAKKGFPSYVISAEIPKKGTYYRVRIGHYVTRKAAEQVIEQLKRQGEGEVILARENVMTMSR
ncbi:MAG: SPOR domain-containing protein [Nitrospiria bacterium]